ncbi:MAG: N-acetylneuraminate synthase family protein [Candidatus Hydrogenedentota bacterium]
MSHSEMRIGDRIIGGNHPAFVIAEAGFNHNGSLDLAISLIDAAADSGADAIKFQSYTTREFLHASVNYAHFFESARLDEAAHRGCIEHAKKRGILFGSTPLDTGWIATLHGLGADFLKIASMDLTSPTILNAAAATGRPVICSTGLGSMDEIGEALRILEEAGGQEIALLHCVSLYPTPIAKANLRAMQTMQATFRRPVGFSDHTLGIDVPLWAVAAGACCIEKHFTLDKTMPGPDQSQSLDPQEFRKMVDAIRTLESALGGGDKEPCDEEKPLIRKTRRGLEVIRDVKSGEQVRRSDFRAVRPVADPDGIMAWEEETLTGGRYARDIAAETLLRHGDISKA